MGSDTVGGTGNTTVLVQMQEEKRVIRVIPVIQFVTTLSVTRAYSQGQDRRVKSFPDVLFEESMTTEERIKRHQFTSRVECPTLIICLCHGHMPTIIYKTEECVYSQG